MVLSGFRDALCDGLVAELGNPESDLGASWTRECYGLLNLAHQQGRLMSGDLSLPNYYMYADMLTAAGFLEKKGDKMTPAYYSITPKGRDVSFD